MLLARASRIEIHALGWTLRAMATSIDGIMVDFELVVRYGESEFGRSGEQVLIMSCACSNASGDREWLWFCD